MPMEKPHTARDTRISAADLRIATEVNISARSLRAHTQHEHCELGHIHGSR
jgi:hypothetical protein